MVRWCSVRGSEGQWVLLESPFCPQLLESLVKGGCLVVPLRNLATSFCMHNMTLLEPALVVLFTMAKEESFLILVFCF